MNMSNSPRTVAWWLFACCAMVFLTMVVGGVTRLTHSGLSIVEWKPLIGADLLHLRDLGRRGGGLMSIGGAGTFDGIVISGFLATMLST